jgi:hypothetical protein
MLEFVSRIERVRAQAATQLAARGIASGAMITTGFIIALAAMPLIATGHSEIAVAALLLGSALSVLGRTTASERIWHLSAALDLVVFASVPFAFAFALADPSRALAASFLLFGFIAAGSASLFANSNRAIATLDALVCIAAFAVACLVPVWFSLIAYVLGVFCFAAAGTRIALVLTRSGA